MFPSGFGLFHADFWSRVKYATKARVNHATLETSGRLVLRGSSHHPYRSAGNSSTSGNNYGSRSTSYRYRRGLAFFMDERRKHYGYLNQEVFNPLFNLELKPEEVRTAPSIFNDYTYHVYVPRNSLYWEKAKDHLNLDRPSLIQRVEQLESNLSSHNSLVHALEKATLNAITEIVGEIDRNWFYYERFIIVLSEFWRGYLRDPVRDRSVVLQRFQTKFPCVAAEKGYLRLGDEVVAQGTEAQRDLVAKATCVASDDVILTILNNAVDSAFRLENQVQDIKFSMSNLTRAIEVDLYATRTKCCPTPYTLFRRAFFG